MARKKTVIVTGGSQGIGAGLVKAFVNRGYNVVATSRSITKTGGFKASEKLESYGNENWAFADNGLMRRRFASINDLPIEESDRKYNWPLGRRPDDHPGLSDLGL